MTNQKMYRFSVQKHAHDIDLRFNVISNAMDDIHAGLVRASDAHYNDLTVMSDRLYDLRNAVYNCRDGKVAMLTGDQYGFAMDCVMWADDYRSDRTRA